MNTCVTLSKQILAVLIMMVLCLALLVGCSKDNASEKLSNKELSEKIDKDELAELENELTSLKKVSSKPEGNIYPVWYGTNRRPVDPNDERKGYTSNRDNQTHYGKCFVVIPKSHKFGSVGRAWYKFWSSDDDPLSVNPPIPLSELAFLEDIKQTLIRESTGRNLLVYIHGYNVTFEEGAIRAGQIGFDLKVPGITAFFSWPSKGSPLPLAYTADLASIEASEKSIANFFIKMAKDTNADYVHIIAHSMGNRGLLRALHRATAQAAIEAGVKFGQIFLAAPDVDVDLFRELASVYPKISERTTLYVSGKDKALEASNWVSDYPRAGYTPPIMTLNGIDTVEATNIDLTILGHGYFAEAAEVLHDMHDLLLHNDPPEKRIRLNREAAADGSLYWVIK